MPAPVAVIAFETVPLGVASATAVLPPCVAARRARSVGRALLARPSSLSSPQRVRGGIPEQGEPVQAQRVDAGIHLAHFSFGVWYLEGSPPIHRSSVHPQRRRVP